MTNQPSDETFLNEMAQRQTRLVLTDPGLGQSWVHRVAFNVAERDRLVALARRAPALTWQPMETAPTEAVDVLVCTKGGYIYIAACYDGRWLKIDALRETSPVWWMPLPPAPAPPEARP